MSKGEGKTAVPPPGGWRRRCTDGAGVARRAELLATPGWHTVLEQFARVTGLATVLFDAEGRMCVGPLTLTPLAERFAQAGCWEEAGLCLKAARDAAWASMEEGALVQRTELGMLALFAVPLSFEGDNIGAIVAGWNFDTFPDPVPVDRLANQIGVPFLELWQIARQQPPVSQEKLAICAGLLKTLSDAFVRERAETLNEQAQARELLALNRLARALLASTCVEELGAAVVEASLALAQTKEARLLVVGGDGVWHTAAEQGPSDAGEPTRDGRERRVITSRLRIPVESPDGTLLGMIEVSETHGYPAAGYQMQMSSLAAQTAVALQKLRLFADLERERAQLERANRTKDEFLAVLSHELRTPLTPILGWVAMLDNAGMKADPDILGTALEAIKRNARQELHLVDELLDLSRILNEKVLLEPELINPTDALASAFAVAQTLAAQHQLHLKMDADQNLPFISADPKRLQQILSNLVANAVKFTADGGTITLGARRAGSEAVEFVVADTGVGISPEALPHIFDRFQQADSTTTRRFGGLGIGLSVVRGLAELHGGRVWAESDGDGHGATFVVRFPVASVPEWRIEAQAKMRQIIDQKLSERQPKRTGRVLVVDDSPDTLVVLKAMIEAAGYEVETADSVSGALESARRFEPDIIISDIGMPESDGFEFLHMLREEAAFASLPVIALTGYASPLDRETALSAGFAAHLAKPVEPPALVDILEKVLSGKA